LDSKLLVFAILAGTLSGVNLFLHKVAADKLDETSLSAILSPSYVLSLARNPYVYVVLAMGLVVLAVDLAFLSNEVPAIVGLNMVIVLGNVLFAALCILLLGEKIDLRIAAGIGFGLVSLVLLSRI
jgi:hypothetical protein